MGTFNQLQKSRRSFPIGERYYHLGEFFKGIDYYSLLLERNPQNIQAYKMRALCYDSLGCDEMANADFAAIRQIAPNSAEAAFGRGMQLRWDSRQAALEIFTEAIDRDPEFAEAYQIRGWLRLDAGDILGAIDDYSECLRICPQHAVARLLRADAFLRIDNFAARVKDLEAFLKFYPNTVMRERLCQQIASGWIKLAVQAEKERKRRKQRKDSFWSAYSLFNDAVHWRDPEDLKS
jgi:tetratricopeptide (TPR) repeat protein